MTCPFVGYTAPNVGTVSYSIEGPETFTRLRNPFEYEYRCTEYEYDWKRADPATSTLPAHYGGYRRNSERGQDSRYRFLRLAP